MQRNLVILLSNYKISDNLIKSAISAAIVAYVIEHFLVAEKPFTVPFSFCAGYNI